MQHIVNYYKIKCHCGIFLHLLSFCVGKGPICAIQLQWWPGLSAMKKDL